MKKIKIGIIGCGGIANGKHLPSLIATKEVEIIAFCDIIRERAEKANKEYADGLGKVFTDYKELLKEKPDAVCVCTPNNSHCEISVAALAAGLHVMCEKPMAMNYAEAKKMIEAQRASGKILTVGYQNRYRPDSKFLKEECKSGALGEIYFAKAHALRRRAVPTWGVFLDGEKQGGGPLIDIGTHALDLTLFMMDNYEPLYVCGTVYHKLNNEKQTANAWGDWDASKFTAEDSAFGFIVMKNGATVILESSWALNTTDVREASTTLCGTKGGATMLGGKLILNTVRHNTQCTEIPEFNAGGVDFFEGGTLSAPVAEALTFVKAVKGEGEPYVLPEQAAVVTRILEGIYKSAASGKPYYFTEEK